MMHTGNCCRSRPRPAREAAAPANHGRGGCRPVLPEARPTSRTPEVPTDRGAQSSNSSIRWTEPLVRTVC